MPINHFRLFEAIVSVESGGDAWAVNLNDGGSPSVGCAQMKAIFIAEVNRILGREIFFCNDRYASKGEATAWEEDCRYHERECYLAFWIYERHYADYWRAKGATINYEFATRIFNGGPEGWRKDATLPYWNKVKATLEKDGKA